LAGPHQKSDEFREASSITALRRAPHAHKPSLDEIVEQLPG
jgi:hypothetical protein